MSLAGRVALVTGGGRGIGRAIALGLAEDGADVAVNYRRDADAAQQTVTEIEKRGRRARAYAASVESYDDDQRMVDAAVRDFGFVDILVNNAGIASRGNSVQKTDPAELERVVRTHAFAAHHLCQLVLPSMKTRPRGDIVMISSGHPLRLLRDRGCAEAARWLQRHLDLPAIHIAHAHVCRRSPNKPTLPNAGRGHHMADV
jgi:NAD(P)-dependent dehydrogenase (short-subunit alcohol dehydrogenase family)